MSTLGSLTAESGFDDVAEAIVGESIRRGHSRDETIAELSTGIQESGLRMVWDPSRRWFGYYQQDGGYPNRMDPNGAITGFMDRIDVKRASGGASPDPFKNIFWLQQRPGEKTADAAYANGRQAYLTEIRSHIDQATQLYDRFATGAPVADNRPAFTEEEQWSPSNQDRGGTKIDLFLLHTQEGDGTAASLAGFLGNAANEVSYHYTVDNGVDVRDIVDTDLASWSVLSANNRSINLCFAGSRAAWSRQQWLDNMGRGIDVAAYLAVQDCNKYGIPMDVNPPPYSKKPGISDHRYVTQVLKDGTHTDVGDGFPWDVFATAVEKYAGTAPVPAPAPAPERQFPKDYTDRELLEWIVAQLGEGDPAWQSKGMTLRDKVWSQN